MNTAAHRLVRSAGAVVAVLGISLIFGCTSDTLLRPGQGGPPSFSILPPGTAEALVADGLAEPTAMVVAPDGRVFVSEQCGTLRVVKNGALLPTPALSLPVDCWGERGLIGVAVDPDFVSNHLLYVYYTVVSPTHNRVSRFTLSGDVAVGGSEQILFELDNSSNSNSHNGGALHFAPDGTLYVSVGDNFTSSNAQVLTNVFGKMLRINADGSIPTDNPFYSTTAGNNRAIWALGLRNPFTFGFQPGTGRLFINDVGEDHTEEINDGLAGSNYGWPNCEGPCSPANPSFRDPVYSYPHGPECAITGGTFYNPATTRFPTSYIGKYLFADFCGGWIDVLDPGTRAVAGFSTGLNFPVDLQVSSDGGLYYLQRGGGSNTGQLWRVDGTANQAPIVTLQPVDLLVGVGQAATFTVSATGTAPIAYQWRRNGTVIPGATSPAYTLPTATLADSGALFSCAVSNAFGNTISSSAKLSVTNNQPPVVTSLTPVAGTTYQGGQTINYSATATDPESGPLPASAFTWEVVFHHDSHTHPFIAPTTGATGGSFVIPSVGETSPNVYYAILLTVRDPLGLTQTFERDILPQTSTFTLQANPAGAQVTLDGQPVTTPMSVLGVVGIQRTLGVSSPQVVNGTSYLFSSWSDGGAATHTIATPSTNTTYTASYAVVPPAAGVTFVQATAATGAGTTALTVPLAAGTLAGGLLVVGVNWSASTFATITDAQGNTFTQIGNEVTTSGGIKTRLYYARGIQGGPESVTVGLTSSSPSLQVYVAEYRGADVTNPLDASAQSSGSSSTAAAGPVTTSAANSLVLGFCVSDGFCSADLGFTARSTHSGNLLEDLSVIAAGPYLVTATSVGGWAMIAAALRPQGGATLPVASVTVSPATASVGTGGTVQLTATPKDAGGNPLAGRVVTWGTGNAAVATVSPTGLVTGVAAGGPVTITATSEGKSGTASVTVAPPAPVTATVTAANKVFDGTTTATITACTLSGTPAGVTCSAAAANFSDPAVGTGKTVTATGLTLGGTNAGNYALTSTTATTTANITAAPPPATAVTFAQATANSGASVATFAVTLPASTTAGDLIVVGVDWFTSGFATISDGQGNVFTQVGTELVTRGGVKTRLYYARNIKGGPETVTVTLTGNSSSLQVYVAEYRGASVTAPLDASAQATGTTSSVTGGPVTTTAANEMLVAFCPSDGACTAGSGFTARSTFSGNLLEDRALTTAGPYSATGSSIGGWAIIVAAFKPQGGTAPPPPAPVTATVTAANKVFDGTTTATITACTLSGNPTGVTCAAAASTFASAAVGTGKTVTATGLTLGGTNAGNYALTSTTATTTANITAASVTATVTAANKVFDGTTTATITACTLSGNPTGVTCAAAASTFASAAVGTGKTVTATGLTLGGANAANYALTSTTATTTANIAAASVTASVTAANKVFDGTTTATITGCTLSGNPAGVTCSAAAATFASAAVGTGKTVTATGLTLGGANAANYALTSTTATTTANITATVPPPPTPVTATVTAANKVYDGTTAAMITGCTLSGNPAGVTCAATAATFASSAVGTGKTVTATGLSLGGANAASYALTSSTATTTANITAASVTATVTAANKVFDGTTAATITGCTLSGNPAGVTCAATSATFASAAVGTGKTVTATGLTLGGANAGNYALTSTTATTTANITAAPPPATAVTFAQATANSGASVATFAVTLPASTTAGDLIVVGVDWFTTGFATISDGQGNVFTQVGTELVTRGGVKTRLYYARNIKGGPETVTVTLTGNSSSLQVYVAEYRGASVTAPLDASAQATGTTSSVTGGPVTTTAANEMLVAFCPSDGACTAGSGFTARSTHSGNLLEDRALATASSYSATGSSIGGWAIIVAAFKP